MIELKRGATSVLLEDLGQGFQVARISSAAGTFEFEAGQLFVLRFWYAGGFLAGDVGPVTPGGHPEQIADLTEGSVVIFWSVREPQWDLLQLVEVRIWIDEAEVVNMTIKVRNRFPNIALHLVTFPILRIKSVGEPGNNVLAIPWQQGGVMKDPAHQMKQSNAVTALAVGPVTIDFPHPSMSSSMQFYAYYLLSGELLYLQTTDGEGFRKDFTISGYDTFTELAHNAWPVNNVRPGNDPDSDAIYDMPYVFQMAVMHGDWYDAARRYREWALKQLWAQRGPIANAPDFSPRVREAAISLLQAAASVFGDQPPLGRPFDMNFYVEEMQDLKKFLGTSAIESGWFHWHTQIFDQEVPEWTPRPTFAEAIRRAHEEGFGVIPYIITNSWDRTVKFYWEHDGSTRAARGVFGDIVLIGPNWVLLTPNQESTNRIIVVHFSPIVTRLGADGLYFDVWSGGGVFLDENYEIRRAGGTSEWNKGKRSQSKMFKDVLKGWDGRKYTAPTNYMVSEFADESLLDYFKLVSCAPFLFPPLKQFRPVPIYASVYHDYQVNNEFIGLVDLADESQLPAYLARLALTFHAGRIVTLFTVGRKSDNVTVAPILEQAPFPEFWDFLRAFVVRFQDVRRFQRLGDRMRALPGSFEDLLDKQEGIPDPTVQGSVWLSGEDVAVYLSSSATGPRMFTVRLAAPAFPIAGRRGLVEIGADGSRKLLRLFEDAVEQEVLIPPLSLVVLEILPETRAIELTTPAGQSSIGPLTLVISGDLDILLAELVTAPFRVAGAGPFSFETILARLEGDLTKLTCHLETSNDRANWKEVALSPATDMTSAGSHYRTADSVGGCWGRLRYVNAYGFIIGDFASTALFYARLPAPLAVPLA